MDATMSEPAMSQEYPIGSRLQLKQYKAELWPIDEAAYNTKPTTPSEWWSKKFPQQAEIQGCPFLELIEPLGDGIDKVTPIAPNIDFLAATLSGDPRLGHKVIYMESEMAFYYYDCKDGIYKATSEDKLGNLMRAFLIRCAEELGGNVDKLNVFLHFRSDKTIRSIVHRAKSILAADDSYFSVDSKHQRQQGPELYERVARAFVDQVLERIPGQTLLLTDAYLYFCEYLRKRNMAPVKRKVFKDLVPPAIQQQYDLGIRHDVVDDAGDGWHYGWKGIRAVDLEAAVQEN